MEERKFFRLGPGRGKTEYYSDAEADGDNGASQRACDGAGGCCGCEGVCLLTCAEEDDGYVDESCDCE